MSRENNTVQYVMLAVPAVHEAAGEFSNTELCDC